MNYYNKHAKEYIDNTKNVDMKEYYDIFESYIDSNAKILDKCNNKKRRGYILDVSFFFFI